MRILSVIGLSAAALALTVSSAFAIGAVAGGAANVRTGPSVGYQVVDQLVRGERVNVTGQHGTWCYVVKGGPDGWVSCRYLLAQGYTTSPGVSIQFSFGNNYRTRWSNQYGMWNGNGGTWNAPGLYFDPRADDDGGRAPRN